MNCRLIACKEEPCIPVGEMLCLILEDENNKTIDIARCPLGGEGEILLIKVNNELQESFCVSHDSEDLKPNVAYLSPKDYYYLGLDLGGDVICVL